MAIPQLITRTDFYGSLTLGIESGTQQDEWLDEIVVEKQTDLLTNFLGYSLYNELDADTWTGTTPDTDKWADFIDGCTYTFEGRTYNYVGFKQILKYYVWYWYKRNFSSFETNSGSRTPDNANSSPFLNNANLAFNYNKCVELYGFDWALLFRDNSNIQSYYSPQPFSTQRSAVFTVAENIQRATAYNFVRSSNITTPDTFADWQFTPMNYIGIL